MTEEEKAEEYANKQIGCGDGYYEWTDIKQAYLAGLHEGQKQSEAEVKELKILISSLVYEINQIWDINEMNDDLRKCAEKIEREVTLSKMAEDNRLVISALGFAVVPPKPKLDVKEV